MKTLTKYENTYSKSLIRQSVLLTFTCMLLTSISGTVVANNLEKSVVEQSQLAVSPKQTTLIKPDTVSGKQIIRRPKIQLAILLDTSGSMDGLIDQTRNQLWQVVNEFSSAKQNGMTPVLEVALFEYGNSGNSQEMGFVRKLNGFTGELDKVSEGLFSLTTNGGNEYCGFAIQMAVKNLQWSQSAQDIKTIFIAGNEPFTQGPINYLDALKLAKQQGISVNTIHAGEHQVGIQSGWQSGALLAGGDYMSIDTNQRVVHIKAPQDKKIVELNAKLNNTYIPYGVKGKSSAERQITQDKLSSNISAGLLAKRAKSKSSSFYNNAQWDLVDAMEQRKIAESELQTMDSAALPESMVSMSGKERKEYIANKAEERRKIKQEISQLSASRDLYVAEEKSKRSVVAPSMSDALNEAIKKQAKQKSFTFDDKIIRD